MKPNDKDKKKVSGTEKLGEILHEFVHHSSWKKDYEESKAVIYYNQIQHDLIQNFSRAYQLAGNELFIYVKSPIHANEIGFMSEKIITILNQKLKANIIHRLKFRVGAYQRDKEDSKEILDPIENVLLSKDEESDIQLELDNLNDDKVSKSLKELYTSILKKRKLDG